MRTTVTIDDALLALAKDRARREGRTLGEVVEGSLRRYLTETHRTTGPALPVFSDGTGLRPGIDPSSNAALFAAADEPADVQDDVLE